MLFKFHHSIFHACKQLRNFVNSLWIWWVTTASQTPLLKDVKTASFKCVTDNYVISLLCKVMEEHIQLLEALCRICTTVTSCCMKCCLFQSFSPAGRICSRGFTILTSFDFATCLYTDWIHKVVVSCIHFYWFSVAFAPGPQDLTSDAIEHFLWPLLKRTSHFFLLRLNNPFIEVLGSYAGELVFHPSPQTPAQPRTFLSQT